MKNNILIVCLLSLIIGLFLGYTVAPRNVMNNHGNMNEMCKDACEYSDNKKNMMNESMDHAMDGMMMDLQGKKGQEYEKAFLENMIIHHVGAIEMAEDLLKETDRPELVKLANDIISAQNSEVDMMQVWLMEWFNL